MSRYMNTSQVFFLQILRDHLTRTTTDQIKGIDWNVIASYASNHEVEGIIYFQCKDFIPNDIRALFHRKFSAALFYFKNIQIEYRKIVQLFGNAGISVFAVKGLEIAKCYPMPALRTMGDLDIVVSQKDKEKAGYILESQGYQTNEKAPDFDWHYHKDNTKIELHHQLLYSEVATDSKQMKFFNHFEDFVKDGKLDRSFHFVFLVAHLRKHILNSGVGFRMFMDIDAAARNDQDLDWGWIENKLEYLGMKDFSSICFALCEEWFGTNFVVKTKDLNEDFFEYATNKIFANGIFGLDDGRNLKNVAISSVLKYGKSRKRSRLILIFKHIFPQYIHMRHLPQYNFIDGKPWLLPAAWGYRFVRYLIGKTNSVSHYLEKIDVSDSEVDSREEELKMWGLA